MNEPRPIPVPPGLGEADLLAWVEGEPLPRDTAAAVARALDADPALARLLGAMKRDRAAVRALPDEAAPDGLAASAQAMLEPALERRMLLGLESSAPVNGTPVSIVQPSRRSILEVVFMDRIGRRFAAAAALLLVAGGTTWVLTGAFNRGGLPRGPEIAAADTAKELAPPPVTKTEDLTQLAMEVPTPPNPADELLEYGPPAPAMTLAAAPAAPPAMPVARALELARENRLVIRVTAASFPESTAWMEGLAARARPESAWRVNASPSPAVMASLTRRQEPIAVTGGPDVRELAASRSASEFVTPGVVPPAPVAAPRERRVFSVDSRLDESALESMLATLAEGGQAAEFVEAAEPLPAGAPAMTPASMLWWTQPPACWAPWGSVPVVVEEK